MQLKANLHFHASEDPEDGYAIDYSMHQAIDEAARLNFDVLAFTLHNRFSYTPELAAYAQANNILLLPGIEKTIEGRHVLVLNSDADVEAVATFDDLRRYRLSHPDIFVIAPHPYYPVLSLRGELEKHRDLFDAVEFSWFYAVRFNYNRPAKQFAAQQNLPFIATSDTHQIKNLNRSYVLLEADARTPEAVYAALRAGVVHNVSTPLSLWQLFAQTVYIVAWFNVRRVVLNFISRKGKQQTADTESSVSAASQ